MNGQIAITGLGCCCGAGCNTVECWDTVINSEVACKPDQGYYFPGQAAKPMFYAAPGSTDKTLNFFCTTGKHIREKDLTRTLLLALTSIREALEHAGLHPADLHKKRVGIAIGTTVGCNFHNESYYIDWKKGVRPDLDPVFFYLSNNLAISIQTILGVSGPQMVITNACASGTDAIGLGKMWLQQDLCDIVLAGGADELSRIAGHGFNSLMLISDNPCQPFDAERSGLNLGEGAGIVVLEKENDARARKTGIKGRVLGYGTASDAFHPTAPQPDGKGLQQAVQTALADAAVKIHDIGLINGHGTGTKANDSAETNAMQRLGFTPDCHLVSTKGATGHTLGAAGGIEAVFTIKALNAGRISGTIGCRTPDSSLKFPPLAQGQEAVLNSNIGISQSLAFGGSNSALILQGGEG